MVSQDVIDLAYGLLDSTIEYNTKMILLFSMLAYSVCMFAFTFWIEKREEEWDEDSDNFKLSRVLLKRFFRWIGGAYIFIFLLMFLFAYRGASLEDLLQLVYGLFIPFFGAMAIWGIMYLWDTVYKFTGIENMSKRNKRRRGRRR